MNLHDVEKFLKGITDIFQDGAGSIMTVSPPTGNALMLISSRIKTNGDEFLKKELDAIMLGESATARAIKAAHYIQTGDELDLSYQPQIQDQENLRLLSVTEIAQQFKDALYPIQLFYAQNQCIGTPAALTRIDRALNMKLSHPYGAFETNLQISLNVESYEALSGKVVAVYDHLEMPYKLSYMDWDWACNNILRPLYRVNDLDWNLAELPRISHTQLNNHMAELMGKETDTHHAKYGMEIHQLSMTLTLGDKTVDIHAVMPGYLQPDVVEPSNSYSSYYQEQFFIQHRGDNTDDYFEAFPRIAGRREFAPRKWEDLPAMVQHQIYNNVQAAMRDKFPPEDFLGPLKKQEPKA